MRAAAAAALLVAAAAPPAAAHPSALEGAVRCVAAWLDAVRLAAPYPAPRRDPPLPVQEADFAAALRLVAPAARAEIALRAARGEAHPLAPWNEARAGSLLHGFELVGARRGPLGTVVVTVVERYRRLAQGDALVASVSEYLAVPVDGEWRVLDRRPSARFADREIAARWADALGVGAR